MLNIWGLKITQKCERFVRNLKVIIFVQIHESQLLVLKVQGLVVSKG